MEDEERTVLWAPWRMAYVEHARDLEGDCLFCRVAQAGPEHDRDNLVVARGSRHTTLLNRYPYNPGHLMVAPLTHTGDLDALPKPELVDLWEGVAGAVRALRTLGPPDGFNVGLNLGRTAGAGIVDHLHVHVVPRWEGDTNFMPVLAGVKVLPQHLLETWEKVSSALVGGQAAAQG